jgi:predicted DNA-binding transcriptional regulator AlpA
MTAQKEFDTLYMTSSEIARRLGVTRAAIIQARQKGMLPDPIMVESHLTIWKRVFIEPFVEAWQKKRNARIGV